MTSTRQRLQGLMSEVSIVAPTAANAERLWHSYQSAYISDDNLLDCIRNDRPINGMTEIATVDTFVNYLTMPWTIAFQLDPAGQSVDGPPGFAIVRYCGEDEGSKRSFRDYYLSSPIQADRLEYRNSAGLGTLDVAFHQGNMLYLVEFVSQGGKFATTALLLAIFQHICFEKMGAEDCQVIGKCLDAATFRGYRNSVGNRNIKQMTESFTLEKLAISTQVRYVRQDLRAELEPACLHFGLYLGWSHYMSRLLGVVRQEADAPTHSR